MPDLLATLCRALGLDPTAQNISELGRPIVSPKESQSRNSWLSAQPDDSLTRRHQIMTIRLLCVFFLCGSVAAQDRSSLSKRVDPNDPIERFAVLAPGGPMIIEVEMRIDGQPFR